MKKMLFWNGYSKGTFECVLPMQRTYFKVKNFEELENTLSHLWQPLQNPQNQ
jgi:hypothetical protein